MSFHGPLVLRYPLLWVLLVTLLFGTGQVIAGNDLVHVVTLGSSAGLKTFAPGRWGLVRIVVVNGSTEAVTVRATVNTKAAPHVRFGRDVWVPARAKRSTSIPLHLPRDAGDQSAFEIVGRVVSGAMPSDSRSGGSFLRVAPLGTTAYLDDDDLGNEEQQDLATIDPAYEVVMAMRADRNLPPAVATINERLLPATIEGWDAVRHIVVAGKRLATEAGAAAALRQWVSEGGRMWIQLNRADLETVRSIFGSAIQIAIVDRVPLTTVNVQRPGAGPELTIDREEPVELIRAHIQGGQVLFEVDRWPAAVQFEYGRGMVLVTLLDAHGWMRPRGQEDAASPSPLWHTDFMALDPLGALAQRMYDPRAEQAMDRDVIAAYVSDRIGYRIPGRGTVLTILLLFCAAIFLVGLMLAVRRRLEHLSWLTASAAMLVALVLVMIGRSHRGEVPPTIADFRMVNVSPESGDYTASGAVAVFQGEQVNADFRSRGTRIDPHLPELAGQIREMIWTDGGDWQWDGTRLPPGVMLLWSDSAGTMPLPVLARAALGPHGLEGLFDHQGLKSQFDAGSESHHSVMEDGLILFPHSPALAANLQPDGRFQSGEQDRLAEGQFTNRALLDDEQRRRQRLLDRWVTQQRDGGTISQPLLVAWLSDGENSLTSAQSLERIETSLIRIPLRLERPPVGTRVLIPSPLIRIRSVQHDSGQSTIFDNRTESWNFPNAQSSLTRLRFQIPETALPLRLESAKLVLDCNMPSRVLEVFAVQSEARSRLGRYVNASGWIETTLDDPRWLKLDSDGGLLLDIAVSDSQSAGVPATIAQSGWSIRSSRLEVTGTTLSVAPSENDEQP